METAARRRGDRGPMEREGVLSCFNVCVVTVPNKAGLSVLDIVVYYHDTSTK